MGKVQLMDFVFEDFDGTKYHMTSPDHKGKPGLVQLSVGMPYFKELDKVGGKGSTTKHLGKIFGSNVADDTELNYDFTVNINLDEYLKEGEEEKAEPVFDDCALLKRHAFA